jgi:hypothetical protein
MLGGNKKGGIGLYVDIGTTGYFKDLKITKRGLKVQTGAQDKVDKL